MTGAEPGPLSAIVGPRAARVASRRWEDDAETLPEPLAGTERRRPKNIIVPNVSSSAAAPLPK